MRTTRTTRTTRTASAAAAAVAVEVAMVAMAAVMAAGSGWGSSGSRQLGKESYELDILEGDGGVENAQRTWLPKVCTKLCFCFFVCVPVDGVEYFRGGKGCFMFYAFRRRACGQGVAGKLNIKKKKRYKNLFFF